MSQTQPNTKGDTMTTYGIRFMDGTIIQIQAATDTRAKAKAEETGKAIHSVWQIGEYWDESGNLRK